MIKLFHMIYIHLLSVFGVNRFMIRAKAEGKANFELKTVLLVVVSILYSFIFYLLLRSFIVNSYDKINIAFLFSTFFCLVYDFNHVNASIFKAEDTSFLFSLPIKRHEIILSKLFHVYLKNMFFVILFFFSAILAAKETLVINETFVLLYFVMAFFVPFVPLIISSILSFLLNYIKLKLSCFYKISFFLIFVVFLCGFFSFFKFNFFPFSKISSIYHTFLHFYPLSFLFSQSLENYSVLSFFTYLVINIVIVYLYVLCISSDYERMCSMLKGIRKKNKFIYHKRKNRGTFFGFLHKELLCLFKYSLYFKSSFYLSLLFSAIAFLFFLFFDLKSLSNFFKYFNLYGPLLAALIGSFGISTIHSFSLERENLMVLRNLPISFNKIFFSKLLVNLLIGSLIIVLNASFLFILVKPNRFVVIMLYVFPFFSLFMNSFISLLLDCIFIDKENVNESAIIKERLITIIPFSLSFVFLLFSFFFINVLGYKYIIGVDLLICIIVILFCFIYYFIRKKYLLNRVFND